MEEFKDIVTFVEGSELISDIVPEGCCALVLSDDGLRLVVPKNTANPDKPVPTSVIIATEIFLQFGDGQLNPNEFITSFEKRTDTAS